MFVAKLVAAGSNIYTLHRVISKERFTLRRISQKVKVIECAEIGVMAQINHIHAAPCFGSTCASRLSREQESVVGMY